MDEVLVDVTAEAQARIARGAAETRWRAHVHTSKVRHASLLVPFTKTVIVLRQGDPVPKHLQAFHKGRAAMTRTGRRTQHVQSCAQLSSPAGSAIPGHQQNSLPRLFLQALMHVRFSLQVALFRDNRHRPMDLRAGLQYELRAVAPVVTDSSQDPSQPTAAEAQAQPTSWQPLLMTGTAIAQEARAAIRVRLDHEIMQLGRLMQRISSRRSSGSDKVRQGARHCALCGDCLGDSIRVFLLGPTLSSAAWLGMPSLHQHGKQQCHAAPGLSCQCPPCPAV